MLPFGGTCTCSSCLSLSKLTKYTANTKGALSKREWRVPEIADREAKERALGRCGD